MESVGCMSLFFFNSLISDSYENLDSKVVFIGDISVAFCDKVIILLAEVVLFCLPEAHVTFGVLCRFEMPLL